MDKYKHNSNQNLKTKNLRYLSNKYTNLTLEGRHLLIKDFLCKEGYDNNIEFLQTGDRYFGRVYEDCRYKDGNQFVIIDNLLYKPLNNHYRLCVPTILLEKVIRRLHKNLLHCSKRKSKKTFRKYFFHPLAEIYITNYADRCVTCQCNSISQIPGKSLINGKPIIDILIRKLYSNFTKKTANHLKKIRKITKTSTMSLIRLTKSTRGKDAIIDKNYHKYTFNSAGENVNYWTCANRSCKARISTQKSTGNLVEQS